MYRTYGTIIPSSGEELGEMIATIELGALDLDETNSKFTCRVIYELWGYPLYDANAN
jgi:hypothetical protein